ncbi:cupin domain-containing protein [Halobacillus fulvus]|nr:cupin domain-containing protein [Halobacillus fulvus]
MTIRKVKDFQSFDDEHMTKQIIFKEEKSQAFVLNFMPGQKLPSHGHPYAQVYLLVLEGKGRCIIDEEEETIKKGDVIHCHKEQNISIENIGSENLSLYAVLAREGSPHTE